MKILKFLLEIRFWTLNQLRVLLYFSESLFIRFYALALHGKNLPYRRYPISKIIKIRLLMNNFIWEVSKLEAEKIVPRGSFFRINEFINHFFVLKLICKDVLKAFDRQREQKSAEFSKEAKTYLNKLPVYYRRNFHYQTDGYLSNQSAQIYNCQVELLFSGTANLMRKMLFKRLAEAGYSKEKEYQILEIACGNGVFTELLSKYFPKSKILATDISEPYINYAKIKYSNYQNISWQAFPAEEASKYLESEKKYDLIVSVYLFHELPLKIRKQILLESYQKLKKGGLFLALDSVQKNDQEGLNDVLENFPLDYHEPFYKNYIETPNKDILLEAGFEDLVEEVCFFSKAFGGFRK